VRLVDEEVEECLEIGLISVKGALDGVALEQVGQFTVDVFPLLDYGLILLLDLLPQPSPLLL
jgi:hypothetical protein